MLAAPLADPRWRTAIRRFFIAYAARRGAILATGEVLEGYLLHPGGVSADGETGTRRSMFAPDGVFGLPPNPVWWTWLSNDYLALAGPRRLLGARRPVLEYLPTHRTRRYPQGRSTPRPTHPPTTGACAGATIRFRPRCAAPRCRCPTRSTRSGLPASDRCSPADPARVRRCGSCGVWGWG